MWPEEEHEDEKYDRPGVTPGLAAELFEAGDVGYVDGGLGFGEAEDEETLCPDKACTPLGRLAIDEAETKGIASTVSFAIGGTALATGITLFLIDAFVLEKKPDEPTGAYVTPWAGPSGGGVSAGVSF